MTPRSIARIATPLTALLAIAGLVAHNPAPIRHVLAQTPLAVLVGDPVPIPSPTPAQGAAPAPALVVVVPTPDLSTPPAGPTAFPTDPAALGNVPPPAVQAPAGATPAPPPVIPVTLCTIGTHADSAGSTQVMAATGGPGGPAPLTITYSAYFQGGFVGVSPTFTWGDGHVGQSNTVTYTTPGTYYLKLSCSEVYNGVTYAAGNANSVPITVA